MRRLFTVLMTFALIISQSVATVWAAQNMEEELLLQEDAGEESAPEELTGLQDAAAEEITPDDEPGSEEGFELFPCGVPSSYDTDEHINIQAIGRYYNWDGVTNVAQFNGADGNLCLAADSGDNVRIIKTDANMKISGTITIKKQNPLFGTAICDKEGNYYIVTGKKNETEDTSVETVFISKYDSNGKFIATTGDTGMSSLPKYYDESFATMAPFEGGNCDAAINGNILTVNYGRHMYSMHQSNSVFSVNITDMSKVRVGDFYQSHSFAQRVVPTGRGFVYVSEGDCYDRSFKLSSVKMSGNTCSAKNEYDIFDFWVREGALDDYNMWDLNDNFAHMGGLAVLSDGNIAFASSSAQSMNSKAADETEEVFIQIFDPYKDLSLASSYVTTGKRSGLAGPNGRDNKTNYGVKWLTSYGKGYYIDNVQIAATDRKEIVVLYELTKGSSYMGVYYIVLDESGKVTKSPTLISSKAKLNPCEMPVTSKGKVFWAGNRYDDSENMVYVYSLDTALTNVTVKKEVEGKKYLQYTGSPLELVNAGQVEGGWFEYALGKDDKTLPLSAEYSKSIPVATYVGTYYVWCRPTGDENHYDGEPSCVTVSVSGVAASVIKQPMALKLSYTGKAQKLVTAGVADGGAMLYSKSYFGPFNEDIPTATDTGSYMVFYMVRGDKEHSDSDIFGPILATIGEQVRVSGIELNKKKATIVKGKKITLSATVYPEDATDKGVTWQSSNSKVASVSSNGVVKGKIVGTAKITATTNDGGLKAVCKVTVKKPVKVKKVKLNKKKVTLKKGKTVKLKAVISPDNATDKTVTWKTSNKNIATVSKKGTVRGLKKGTVKITVTTTDGDKKATCSVRVK